MEGLALSSLPRYLQQAYISLHNISPEDQSTAANINAKTIFEIHLLPSARERLFELLLRRHCLTQQIADFGKCYPPIILARAETYEALEYDDLAAFDAYVVYILCQKELSDEFVTDLEAHSPDGEEWNASTENVTNLQIQSLAVLVRCLARLGALDDARRIWKELQDLHATARRGDESSQESNARVVHLRWKSVLRVENYDVDTVPRILKRSTRSMFGAARREIYPWSTYEPDRNTPECIAELNQYLASIAPELEAKLTALPAFDGSGDATGEVSHQLGLFAKIDLAPDQEVLHEKSILTAIRPLEDALCDACGQDLEGIPFETIRQCEGEDCDITFCSEDCHDRAVRGYHRPKIESSEDEGSDEYGDADIDDNEEEREGNNPDALSPFCGNQDLSLIGRPTNTDTPEWDLYFLLQTRAIAMSVTQNIHPLKLSETNYLWADFNPSPFTAAFPPQSTSPSPSQIDEFPLLDPQHTLPFSLTHTIIHPLDYFTTLSLTQPKCTPYTVHWLQTYDPWILQTLASKFRSVANATQSTYDGKPEIAAVHPGWCLANHSCAPNVRWGGTGGTRRFWVREGTIKKGEEIWSHYTDVRLGVGERRERLREVLGGVCRCERCLNEAEAKAA